MPWKVLGVFFMQKARNGRISSSKPVSNGKKGRRTDRRIGQAVGSIVRRGAKILKIFAPRFCRFALDFLRRETYNRARTDAGKLRRTGKPMYGFLLALIYLAFFSLGLPDSLLGAGWPAMHLEFDVPVSYMGIISMVISGGTVVSSLLSDRLTGKFGTKWVTVVSVFLTVVALLGFSFATKYWILILLAVPYGLGAGAVDAALNNYIALHYKARHMNWLHCFWGLGAIVSPFMMGYALKGGSWNGGYRVVGYIQLGIALLLLVTLPAWKIHKDPEGEASRPHLGLWGALKLRGVLPLLIGFFAYCAAEATTMYWASTYFSEVKHLTAEQAANFASLFYIGITAGRFVSGFLADKLGDRKMILIGTGILTCGIILMMLPIPSYSAAIAAFLVIGFGCGPIYPCIIHSTPDHFGAENSGAIIGIQMASAYIGATFVPPLFGLLANLIGFSAMPFFLLGFFVLMIVLTELTFRLTQKNRERKEKTEEKSSDG